MRFTITFSIIILILTCMGCKSTDKKNETKNWDSEGYMLESQKMTSKFKYQKAIDILNEMMVKFPEEDKIAIYYNIGFNYYKLRNFIEANKYFDNVRKSFEQGEYSEAQRVENRKFVVLSDIIRQKIEQMKEELKDPYHINEEKDKNKVIKPQKF